MTPWAFFAAVFLACAVEAVEATTIVLAAGTTRDWGSTFTGVATALVVLAALIAALGPAISSIPIQSLRLVVGALLLIFGLQWLRKAVLRAGGSKALHDEAKIFDEQVSAARVAPRRRVGSVSDWYAFTLAFKGVLLEGLEVVFIAVTFGANQKNLGVAAVAALAAVLVVSAGGFALRAPLTRVPENSMKFVVGTLLTGFGMFWGAEGAGASWPGSDAALLVIIPGVALLGLFLAVALRYANRAVLVGGGGHGVSLGRRVGRLMTRVRAFGLFWYDFVVGDDWKIAAGVLSGLLATALVGRAGLPSWWLLPAATAPMLSISIWTVARSSRSHK